MALLFGGAALLPSCLNDKGKSVVKLKHIDLDAGQQALVADVADVIIPKTDTPGSKELGLHLFVLKMVDDCFNKEGQETFVAGMKEFNEAAKKKHGHDFVDCSPQEKLVFVSDIDKRAHDRKPDEEKDDAKLFTFYSMLKGQTVFAYTTSKYFMTKQIVYELVPGRYNAYFPVKEKAAV
ncbi:gluconate 2-dehydrogenase subunit 3 family protein [Mucilaginibacter segetis]|uniref:Gluconate 2-dehydrogenase subunit 3 family protein n=1 Tax=Mucilaginibacter segetis TaxID=2793071 RepID=A0A934PVU3_9SPHI|nr:gluconate 2-dehydrogenase subunit 3 family protein [Mucilaginibacter segetis]MBK0380999.1 gluconate 2-dehydrogenase subunit 3 family protein [Mucilaginibacter segetis]